MNLWEEEELCRGATLELPLKAIGETLCRSTFKVQLFI
jgi:hypothetical protein